jgi:hypothetical protein
MVVLRWQWLFVALAIWVVHPSSVIVQESLDVEPVLLDLSELPDGLGVRLPQNWKLPTAKAKLNLPLFHKISPSFCKCNQWDPFRFLSDPQDLKSATETDENLPAAFMVKHLSTLFGKEPLPQPSQLTPSEMNGLLAYLIVELSAMDPSKRPSWAGESPKGTKSLLTWYRASVPQSEASRSSG